MCKFKESILKQKQESKKKENKKNKEDWRSIETKQKLIAIGLQS